MPPVGVRPTDRGVPPRSGERTPDDAEDLVVLSVALPCGRVGGGGRTLLRPIGEREASVIITSGISSLSPPTSVAVFGTGAAGVSSTWCHDGREFRTSTFVVDEALGGGGGATGSTVAWDLFSSGLRRRRLNDWWSGRLGKMSLRRCDGIAAEHSCTLEFRTCARRAIAALCRGSFRMALRY